MMIPFSLAAYYYDFSEIPPPIEIAPLWSYPSVSMFGLRGKEGFEWRSCANVSYWPIATVSCDSEKLETAAALGPILKSTRSSERSEERGGSVGFQASVSFRL